MKWFAKLDRTTLAIGSLVMAAVILLSVNIIAANVFRTAKADLTEDNLFTIAEGTRQVLASIDEPIDVRVYYSRQLGEAAPSYARYFDRVKGLLEQYRDLAQGKLRVSFLNPEPFSDTEDRAVAAGLKGVRLNSEGDRGYFGLVATNSTDNQEVIEFFSPQRERFLEYDLTKLVHNLVNPKKPVIGLITGLEIDGGPPSPRGRQQQPWTIMEQIRETYEVYNLDQDVKEIPEQVDTLMIVHPDELSEQAAYAIDQFVLQGGRVLAFVDPYAETDQASRGMAGRMAGGGGSTSFDTLLNAWGVNFDRDRIAGDTTYARRVQFGTGARPGEQPVVTDYVAWLALDQSGVEQSDVLSGGIEQLNLASPGFLSKREGASTEMLPILRTSSKAMRIEAGKLRRAPDPAGLLRDYEPGGEPLTLAARINGDIETAFPDGPPKSGEDTDGESATPGGNDAQAAAAEAGGEEAAGPTEPQVKQGSIEAIVVADADMLHDRFWVDANNFFGSSVMVPKAHNGSFVLNALDNLAGSSALISLRGRGVDNRPFELVEELRKEAERRYREKEKALVSRLEEVKKKLASLENRGGAGEAILSDADRQSIESFRNDMVSIRRELREVKHALRKDIDRLDAALKFVNIAGVPFLIGVGGIAVAIARRRRSARR